MNYHLKEMNPLLLKLSKRKTGDDTITSWLRFEENSITCLICNLPVHSNDTPAYFHAKKHLKESGLIPFL